MNLVTETSRRPLPRMSNALVGAFRMMNRAKPTNPVRTGFCELDDRVRELAPKEVTMLAADSGAGKSTLATQAVLHAAASGHGGVYLNLEMAEEKYGLRTVAGHARVHTKRAATGQLSDDERGRMSHGFESLRVACSRVVLGNAREHRSAKEIRELCQRAKAELAEEGTPLRLVVVDHVLKIVVRARTDDRDGAGKERADLLKDLAEALDVHVLALVHITREGSKTGKMPTKNDLASSAWFDRDADNVLIFHQRRHPDGTFATTKATLACQKSRWGEPFAVELEYQQGYFYPWTLEARPS